MKSQVPNDVCLFFPHLERWSSSATLSAISPYFKLLDSECAKFPNGQKPKNEKGPGKRGRDQDRTFDDSDDETDAIIGANPPFPKPLDSPHHLIPIVDFSYTTYIALLCWIDCRFLRFVPLSTFPVATRKEDRLQQILAIHELHPLLPYASSPTSIERLAHLLEFPQLRNLALNSIQAGLTVDNITFQLVGELSKAFPEIQEIVMTFAVKNWQKIKGSASMIELQESIDAGGYPTAATILLKLARRF